MLRSSFGLVTYAPTLKHKDSKNIFSETPTPTPTRLLLTIPVFVLADCWNDQSGYSMPGSWNAIVMNK